MRGFLNSAGETVYLECDLDWVADLLRAAAPGEWRAEGDADTADVRLVVESSRAAFPNDRAMVLTRGAWLQDDAVVLEDACATGFTIRLEPRDGHLLIRARYRPSFRDTAGKILLSSRFRLVATAVLLNYPLLWWAGVHGRAPLHASSVATSSGPALLAGPGGVGKSTLVARQLAAGHRAASDNLVVSDGHEAFGLAEPLRLAGGRGGRRAPHGRRESGWPVERASLSRPDRVVVVRLGDATAVSCVETPPSVAARSLVTGTLMAGELRRYWAYASTLAEGTGLGPAQPDVAAVADQLTRALPCFVATLRRGGLESLDEVLERARSGVSA